MKFATLYVLDPDYELASLESVEKHVNAKKHLLGVPSAKKMKQDGLDLAEMIIGLLKKVEDLALYAIRHEQDMGKQAAEMKWQAEEIFRLHWGR